MGEEGGGKGKLGGGSGGERVLVVRVCRVRTFMPTIKIGILLHQNWKCFLTKRYDKLEKQGTNWEEIFANTYLSKNLKCKT